MFSKNSKYLGQNLFKKGSWVGNVFIFDPGKFVCATVTQTGMICEKRLHHNQSAKDNNQIRANLSKPTRF